MQRTAYLLVPEFVIVRPTVNENDCRTVLLAVDVSSQPWCGKSGGAHCQTGTRPRQAAGGDAGARGTNAATGEVRRSRTAMQCTQMFWRPIGSDHRNVCAVFVLRSPRTVQWSNETHIVRNSWRRTRSHGMVWLIFHVSESRFFFLRCIPFVTYIRVQAAGRSGITTPPLPSHPARHMPYILSCNGSRSVYTHAVRFPRGRY